MERKIGLIHLAKNKLTQPHRKNQMKNKSTMSKKTNFLATAGIIAALYIALTYLAMAFGLDKNAIQVRFSEALCTMAILTPAAIPGLTVGCFLANILTGCAPLDIILGSIATLVGAVGAYYVGVWYRKIKKKGILFLSPIPTILANTITVPYVIYVCYTAPEQQSLPIIGFYAITVFIGEVISAGVLGMLLYFSMEKRKRHFK